jgi:hypothetical protein
MSSASHATFSRGSWQLAQGTVILQTTMSGSIMKTHIYIAGVEPGSLQFTSSSAE